MTDTVVQLFLPWPPSVNAYWRHPTKGKLAGRHLISADGRDYRAKVHGSTVEQLRHRQAMPMKGRLSVEILAYPPDRRSRDLDNLPKAILDSLTHAGLWVDDAQIDRLLIERCTVVKEGGIEVRVATLEAA